MGKFHSGFMLFYQNLKLPILLLDWYSYYGFIKQDNFAMNRSVFLKLYFEILSLFLGTRNLYAY